MPAGKPTLLLLLVYTPLAAAQQIDVGNANPGVRVQSLFDEIQDQEERSAFRRLWQARDPAQQKAQALEFIEKYPRSVLLKEAYEIAARAFAALGDDAAALSWAQRSLRLLPENPFLLAMAANLAAKLGQYDWAAGHAHQALDLLDRAAAPAALPASEWPRARDNLRETALFVLGRAAAADGRNREAERWLLQALSLNGKDYDALDALGIVRTAAHDDTGAADCFAEAMRASGSLGEAARVSLQRIYDRQPDHRLSFEQFASSRKWQTPAPVVAPSAKTSADRYAGSAACRECHASQYDNWKQTGMAKMFRPDAAGDVIGDFSGRQIVSGSARAFQEDGRRFIELRDQESGKWTRYPIDFLVGSKWQQAYASKLTDGGILVLPIQYSRTLGSWVNYWTIVDGGTSARSDLGHFRGTPDGALYQRDCAPCHTSQLRYANAAGLPSTAGFREAGVDCEMCHGPSLAHVEAAKAGAPIVHAANTPPVAFRRISPDESVAICAQCHTQSAIHEPEPSGAVNFTKDARPFYRAYQVHLLSDFTRKAFYADGRFRATTFIGEAFMRSRCFREGGATCVTCHDPHSAHAATDTKSLRFDADSDQMCLQCHQSLAANPARHTRHAAATEASRCVTCHMPRTMDALLFRARSHQIDEVPDAQMTERFGETASPNACLECHRDRPAAWLTQQLSAWKSR